MSQISECLERVLRAVHGRDVRQSIHDSIMECYTDVSSGKTIADQAAANANAAAAAANKAAEEAAALAGGTSSGGGMR